MSAPRPRPAPRHRLEDAAFRALFGALNLLPYRWRVPFGGWLVAWLVAPLAGYRRRIRENLALVMPGLARRERRRLLRAVPDNIGRMVVEIYSGAEFCTRVAGLPMHGPGVAAIEAARDAGRPVIFATAHFGNPTAIAPVLAARGFRFGSLYMEMTNRRFNEHYVRALGSVTGRLFPRNRKGLAEMTRWLRGGGMLGILLDQHMRGGVKLAFLGHEALTALSAAELALRHDAPLVPIYAIRRPDGLSFEIIVEAPVAPATPEAMTQALNDSLERRVRRHPEQWFWIHRRWKGAGEPVQGRSLPDRD